MQALIAIYDNCNSLHTNAYDEAITTPTDESVRRAMAIQLVINREWGVAKNENPNQGAFIIEELTDLVEEAVLKEFEAIAARGGVLGAMETGYQRGKIQEESLYYEHKKHDGSYPIIGVNTFRNPKGDAQVEIELARSTEEEKQSQIKRLRDFQQRHAAESGPMLQKLRDTVIADGNVFAVLVDDAVLLLARPDHDDALRSGRAVPPEHVRTKGTTKPSSSLVRNAKPGPQRSSPYRSFGRIPPPGVAYNLAAFNSTVD